MSLPTQASCKLAFGPLKESETPSAYLAVSDDCALFIKAPVHFRVKWIAPWAAFEPLSVVESESLQFSDGSDPFRQVCLEPPEHARIAIVEFPGATEAQMEEVEILHSLSPRHTPNKYFEVLTNLAGVLVLALIFWGALDLGRRAFNLVAGVLQ